MNKQGILGSFIMCLGGFCPLVHVPLANWNYFKVDENLAYAFFFLVALGFLASFLSKPKFLNILGWCVLALVVFTLFAIHFKSQNYFNFKLANKIIGSLVKYKWGWFVIVFGALMLVTIKKQKTVSTLSS